LVSSSYVGRHRPGLKRSRGRQFVVPVALLGTTVAGGLVIRDAGASELSPEAAAMKNVSSTVAGLGLAADPSAVAAAAANRSGSSSSRDLSRDAKALVVNASVAGHETAAEASARADRAAAEKAARAKAQAAAKAKAKVEAEQRALAASHRWVKPLSGYKLTSGFGFRWGRLHPAQDLACPVGTPVHALSSGKVIFAGWSTEGYGYLVKIQYWDGTVSWMAHNTRLVVSLGDKVVPGQTVSYSGNTGHSTGPHVHLEIHPGDGGPVVPRTWLAKRGVRL
jgi:murein DD-endopeptidase MepM/ murein hydrolase activator NlpD